MRIRFSSTAVVLPVVLPVLAIAVAAQDPQFKAANRTVAVYATVTEAGGHLVPDLGREAFRVKDDGKVQELTIFTSDVQPITVTMMLDRSGSMRGNFGLVEQAAEAFITDLGPKDRARIGSFANRIQVDPRTFTSDHDELLEILRRDLQNEGPTPLWNAINVGITTLLHQEGRRVVLVFTDGVDAPSNPGANNSSLKEVMKRADEEDVMVYAIGLAGNNGRPGGGRGGPPPGGGGRGRRGYPGFSPQLGGFGGWQIGGRKMIDGPDPGLVKLADATGGGYLELTNTADLQRAFRQIVDELHHQYLLGFTPKKLDGKTHRLEVKVNDETYTARARKTYLAR